MDFTFFNQLLLILAASVTCIALFHRLRLPPTLGYLAVGIILGPTATGLIAADFKIELLAEVGVVFLLFSLGLEFSVARVLAMRREVFGLGGLQVLLASALLFALAIVLGVPWAMALVFACGLSLSSTAIVSKELSQRGELKTHFGQQTIAILIFQDIAAVLFLILIPSLTGDGEHSLGWAIALAFIKGIGLTGVMVLIGKYLLPPLFDEVARVRSQELFVLTALLVALLAAWATHALHLSMALGGFLAGMVLGESHYRHQIETDIRPFRDILLGLFFVSVGLMLDLPGFLAHWWQVVVLAAALMLFKLGLITLLSRAFGASRCNALRTGINLAQGGEFCLALIALAGQLGLLDHALSGQVLAICILSMAATPLLIRLGPALGNYVSSSAAPCLPSVEGLQALADQLKGHVLICGFGRMGQSVGRFLEQNRIPYIAVDDDAVTVREAHLGGQPIYYGDCRRLELLQACGLDHARLVVICIDPGSDSSEIISAVRQLAHKVPVLVRTRDDTDLAQLKALGATEVVPELTESSLVLASHALLLLGYSAVEVRNQIQAVRAGRYELLRGHFPGFDSPHDTTQLLHAVPLPEGAFALNSPLDALGLEQFGVTLKRLKRQGAVLDNPRQTPLEAGDIVVLIGAANQLEAAEDRLLSGR